MTSAAGAARRPTATSTFGSGRRESHDASGFYARFSAPAVSGDATVVRATRVDQLFCKDAREVTDAEVAPASVALVVTSPPYFAGKEYEEALGEGHVPATYFEYLRMLEDVLGQCATKLEAGGRMAVNVANLGRKPYRSLAGDVVTILQDRLGLLLRGEIVWQKARGAGGSCAWGSFQSPHNPVLRDVTERIVVASKGRFDRAVSRRERERRSLPFQGSIWKEEFMEGTTDLWEIPPESATRVGHPAPFPVELPQRLIELYTYVGDLVLDPFMGSGSTAVAAVRTDRHYIGFDTDPDYLAVAERRVAEERARRAADATPRQVRLPAVAEMAATEDGAGPEELFQSRAVREGSQARDIAKAVLRDCGFAILTENKRFPTGAEVNIVAADKTGAEWLFDVSGAFTSTRPGLRRTDTVFKALGKAAILKQEADVTRLILLTTNLPPRGSAGAAALRTGLSGKLFVDAIEMLSPEGQERLEKYSSGEYGAAIGGDLHLPSD